MFFLSYAYKSIADFNDFKMAIGNESISGENYSVTVIFSHEVIVQSIGGLESNESCSINTTQFTKTVKTSCVNLNYSSLYTLLFQGLINFTHTVVSLEFILNFVTMTLASEQVSGKRNYIDNSQFQTTTRK